MKSTARNSQPEKFGKRTFNLEDRINDLGTMLIKRRKDANREKIRDEFEKKRETLIENLLIRRFI